MKALDRYQIMKKLISKHITEEENDRVEECPPSKTDKEASAWWVMLLVR